MLRKRNRAVTSKQALMADHGSLSSPTDKYRTPTSSFFNSPRLFTSLSSKGLFETEAVMSPTSILDCKPFSVLGNSFCSDRNSAKSPDSCLQNRHHPWKKSDSRGVGLVDVLTDERTEQESSEPNSRMVLFGSQLKIQIPHIIPPSAISSSQSPKSPADFGMKTRNSRLGSFSPAFGSVNSGLETPVSPLVFTGSLSASEMELSEDYTCVISRGPNPRTTHIFDNCIVESCCGDDSELSASMNNCFLSDQSSYDPPENFLSFCFNCKKNLGQGKDIYMYRGEKAFCSRECRYQEMLFDEGMEKSEFDGTFKSCS